MRLLVADIGGTNSRCAVGEPSGAITRLEVFRNADFPGPEALLATYLGRLDARLRPRAAALAVAAPIRGDEVRMMNIDWGFSRRSLAAGLGLARLDVVNDFAALAWSLPTLGDGDLRAIGGGAALPDAARLVLGPGTGLGVAGLVPVDGGWQALPGEGGHATVAACDAGEEELVRRARERFGHCSAERLVSGPGLAFLHHALHGGEELDPAVIGARAVAGDAAALGTFEAFFRLLGTVAGNAALTLGAIGGVYIGGGIVPRYVDLIARSGFRERFEAKGRYQHYMSAIPTSVITAANPALGGLVAFARSRGEIS